MIGPTPRILLAIASLLMAAGSASHAAAFPRTQAAVTASNLEPFFAHSLELLWLADSATMLVVGAAFGMLAARPSLAGRPVVIALAMIPAATGALIYTFLGGFVAGHLLLATAALAVGAGVQWRSTAKGGLTGRPAATAELDEVAVRVR